MEKSLTIALLLIANLFLSGMEIKQTKKLLAHSAMLPSESDAELNPMKD